MTYKLQRRSSSFARTRARFAAVAEVAEDPKRRRVALARLLDAPLVAIQVSEPLAGAGLALAVADVAVDLKWRQWPWLERQRLIEVHIHERIHKVVLLREDGSGHPYTHPGASTPTERAEGDYFILPHLYWHAGWYGQMDLATRVVLLIALSRPPGEFILPIEHAANWYGFSAESMRHGLKTLQLLGLLEHRTLTFPAPLSRLGYRTERRYRLSGPLAGYYDRDSADAVTDAQDEGERPA